MYLGKFPAGGAVDDHSPTERGLPVLLGAGYLSAGMVGEAL